MAAEDFENCNKKIAAFIVTSVSLAIPAVVSTSSVSASEGVIMPTSQAVQNIMRYAGPPSTWGTIEPISVVQPVERYAGPPSTWGTDIVKEPIDRPIVRYAGPQIQSADVNLIKDNANKEGMLQNFGGYQINAGHYIFR